jgi:hypothetical protein
MQRFDASLHLSLSDLGYLATPTRGMKEKVLRNALASGESIICSNQPCFWAMEYLRL